MKTRTNVTFLIPPEQAGLRVEQVLRAAGFSRHLLIQLKKIPGSVRLDNEPVLVVVPVQTGQVLTVSLRAITAASETIVPTDFPLTIAYEDADCIVVNKPAGVPVHPSQGHYDDTLCNALAFQAQKNGEPFSAHAIGRLDRDTSGLVLFARHPLAAAALSTAMRERRIHREYRALCTGLLPESGTISAPIARAHGSTIERIVSDSGEPAITHFHRLSFANGYSLAAVQLETGRTHQIRVHMKHIGYPLPGDFLYNPADRSLSRQALHSYRLTFPQPLTGRQISLTASLPDDMRCIADPHIISKESPL